MNIRPNPTRKKPESPTPARHQRSLLVVTSVATFLVALMLIYWPRAAQPVSAIVERSAQMDSGLEVVFTQDEADDLKLPENLEIAWQDVAREMTEPTDQWLETFASNLEVEIRAARRGDRSHLVAIYRGESPLGVSVLNQLMENFVENHAPEGAEAAMREKAAADKAVEETAAKAELAEDRKDSFFLEHSESVQQDTQEKTEKSKPLLPQTAPPRNPSPLWTELSEKLKKLQVQRAEMLTRLHPVHPSVNQLDQQIDRIKGSLSEISPSYPSTDGLDVPATEQEEVKPEESVVQPTPIDEYRQLQEDYRVASEAHKQAVLVAQEARQEVDRLSSIKLRVAAWAERSEPSMLMRLVLAVLISVSLGLLVAKSGATFDPTVRTPEDAEANLPVPVVGILPATEVSPNPLKIRPPLWCRSIKLAGQLTVVSFIFCFLLLAILDNGFLIEACKHPLSAFPTAVHRLPDLISG